YDSSMYCWSAALKISVEKGFSGEELHNMRAALNNIYFLLGDYTGAMRNSIEALARAEQFGDVDRQAHYNNVIGYIHMKLGNYSKSRDYYAAYLDKARQL